MHVFMNKYLHTLRNQFQLRIHGGRLYWRKKKSKSLLANSKQQEHWCSEYKLTLQGRFSDRSAYMTHTIS